MQMQHRGGAVTDQEPSEETEKARAKRPCRAVSNTCRVVTISRSAGDPATGSQSVSFYVRFGENPTTEAIEARDRT